MTIDHHYQQQLDTDAVIARVRQHYPAGADLHQLAPLDQLHIGGLRASERLLRHLDPARHRQVLDIGSGAGGLMRQAARAGIRMIGLDITHALNRLNRGLNRCLPTPVDTPILTADAHRLPFADGSIDLVLFQHSFLNMPDDRQVLRECRRVLSAGGELLMHEVVLGPQADRLRFPVPWAEDAAHSHLLTEPQLRACLQQAGFHALHLEDWSEEALHWRQRQLDKERSGAPVRAPLSPALILGSRFRTMGENLAYNLASRAIRVVEVVARRD